MQIKEQILSIQNDLPNAERRLADVVLSHLDTIAVYSASELAEKAKVSAATAVRFFRRLGFSSYNEFRVMTRGQMGMGEGAPSARLGAIGAPSIRDDMTAFVTSDIQNIAATFETLSPEQLDRFIALVLKAKHVWIAGFRNGQILANYAHSLIQQLRSDVHLLVGNTAHLTELLSDVQADDLVIVMDFRRRSVLLPKVVDYVRAEGASLAFLTDLIEPALVRRQDVVFTVQTRGEYLFDSHASTLSLINYLASRVALRAGNAVAQKLHKIEAIHRRFRDLKSDHPAKGGAAVTADILVSDHFKLFRNPAAAPTERAYDAALREILSLEAFATACDAISKWPGYTPTALKRLPGLAEEMGLETVYYKDESTRFGLGSFKALGGAYAVNRLLTRELQRHQGGGAVTLADLARPEHRAFIAGITVTCATDGNHGRSVAWGAQNAGCNCIIYIHETVSAGREQAIASYGATVVRVPGNYDDAVRRAAEDARANGYFVVSDTSYPGYMDVPRDVMQGYSVMVQEALEQIGDAPLPTHVFIQGGVGGLAAAVCAHLWETLGENRPRLIVVEPDKADCLLQSALAGKPVPVTGDLDTVMAGLACGEVSLLAWEILQHGATAFMSIPDEAALETMRRLARADLGDAPIVAGESAVAGVAACRVAAADAGFRQALGLDASSRVLFFSSEGDTDPDLYRSIIGLSAAEVLAQVTA